MITIAALVGTIAIVLPTGFYLFVLHKIMEMEKSDWKSRQL
jgi:hypothetical protein